MARLHPNVLKARKQRQKGRRAYLTPIFGLIKVPRRVGKSDVPEDMQALFNYRSRGNTCWDAVFNDNAPLMLSAERIAVRQRIYALTDQVPENCNILVREGGITKTRVKFFFQPDYRYCFWIKEDWRNMVIWKSMEYHGTGARDRAYFDLEHNRIKWIEYVELSTETLPG